MNTLPRVLLNSHAIMTERAMEFNTNRDKLETFKGTGMLAPGIKSKGKCQKPHITPIIKLEVNAFRDFIKLGRAYPRHPVSSAIDPPIMAA